MSKLLSDTDVQKVAKLARLDEILTPEDLVLYLSELNQILSYVDQLSTAQTNTLKTRKRSNTVSSLRTDTTRRDTVQAARTRNAIVKQFPNSQGDLLILPGIFHDN